MHCFSREIATIVLPLMSSLLKKGSLEKNALFGCRLSGCLSVCFSKKFFGCPCVNETVVPSVTGHSTFQTIKDTLKT
jgi:hypothetical protein